MKKRIQKSKRTRLAVRREVLRNLSADQLGQAQGGNLLTILNTVIQTTNVADALFLGMCRASQMD